MKPKLLISLLIPALCFSCAREKMSFTLVNNLDMDRQDEYAILSRPDIEEITGGIPEGSYLGLEDELGNIIPYQLDDMDGDGNWDELFLVTDIGTGASLKVKVSFIESKPDFRQRTNIRFSRIDDLENEIVSEPRLESNTTEVSSARYQFEGPGWENDIVGFRNYYDRRNGIDIFGKKVPDMVLDEVDTDESVSYHEMQDWGMDILKVGNSLGAGSLAMLCNDSLYRVGDSGTGGYRIVTEGPLRSVLELTFTGWQCGDRQVDLTHRISIPAGRPGYMSTVTASGMDPDSRLVAGIVNMHSDTLYADPQGDMAWIATHDAQAELEMYLGMALACPAEDFIATGTARDSGDGIIQTYFMSMAIEENTPVSFWFITSWEGQDPGTRDPDHFLAMLRDECTRIASPLEVDY
jgi:hypothetical protein